MVAYSFKKQFAEPILAGTKRQTIRADRKRHARPGEELQLYTGMRTKQCRKVGRSICEAVLTILIDMTTETVVIRHEKLDDLIETPDDLAKFAMADGFASWADMKAFWRTNHPGVDEFEGVMIRWGALL